MLLGSSFCFLGFCTPAEYQAEVSKEFDCSKEVLWNIVSTPEGYAKLKNDLRSFEITKSDGSQWVEYDNSGNFRTIEVLSKKEGEKLVLKVIDSNLGFEKIRTYRIYGNEDHSVLTVNEKSVIEKLLLRSTMVLSGRDLSIKKEMQALSKTVSL